MTNPDDREQKQEPAQGASSKACGEGRLFSLGQTVITPGASELLWSHGILPHHLLNRHASGDFGDLEPDDIERNREAVTNGARIFSAYNVAPDARVWIITEADPRAVTTILLPSEY